MDRILPARRDWPLHDAQGSRAVEAAASRVLPPHALMRRAGAAAAALTRALHPHAHRVWVACGPGNNGGDGLDAAIHLRAAGLDVHLTLTGDPARLPADAADALARAQVAGLHVASSSPRAGTCDVAIDALLGLGTRRAPEGDLAACIRALNALPCPVLAVDLPSGLHPDRGHPLGEDCVVADHTLSLLTLKPGLFTGRGRDHAGEVWHDTLGVAEPATQAVATLIGDARLDAPRRHAQHKGSFGDVAIVGGAPGMSGAALLAARAAHAAGAGRVFVDVLDDQHTALDPARPELMFRDGWSRIVTAQALADATVVAGCGGGERKEALPRLLSGAARLVLDADALNAIAADPMLGHQLVARAGRGRDSVLTPHPLEAARLLGTTASEVQADRLSAAQAIADRYGSVVVLKGSGTVVALPGGRASINGTGNAALASAGTGDVLAGWLGGVWSASGCTAIEAARHAVWLHGLAADRSGVMPLRAADLIEAMLSQATPPRR